MEECRRKCTMRGEIDNEVHYLPFNVEFKNNSEVFQEERAASRSHLSFIRSPTEPPTFTPAHPLGRWSWFGGERQRTEIYFWKLFKYFKIRNWIHIVLSGRISWVSRFPSTPFRKENQSFIYTQQLFIHFRQKQAGSTQEDVQFDKYYRRIAAFGEDEEVHTICSTTAKESELNRQWNTSWVAHGWFRSSGCWLAGGWRRNPHEVFPLHSNILS